MLCVYYSVQNVQREDAIKNCPAVSPGNEADERPRCLQCNGCRLREPLLCDSLDHSPCYVLTKTFAQLVHHMFEVLSEGRAKCVGRLIRLYINDIINSVRIFRVSYWGDTLSPRTRTYSSSHSLHSTFRLKPFPDMLMRLKTVVWRKCGGT